MTPSAQSYAGARIRLANLADQQNQLVGAQFENCDIYGPAVLVFDHVELGLCNFDMGGATFDALFIQVPTGSVVVGPMRLIGCAFRSCRFHGVGILTTPEEIANIKSGFINPSGGGGLPDEPAWWGRL